MFKQKDAAGNFKEFKDLDMTDYLNDKVEQHLKYMEVQSMDTYMRPLQPAEPKS